MYLSAIKKAEKGKQMERSEEVLIKAKEREALLEEASRIAHGFEIDYRMDTEKAQKFGVEEVNVERGFLGRDRRKKTFKSFAHTFGSARESYIASEGTGKVEEEVYAFRLTQDYAKGTSLGIITRIDVVERLKKLQAENEALRRKAADFEEKYLKCSEWTLRLEQIVAGAKEKLDEIREEDLARTSSHKVGTEPGK